MNVKRFLQGAGQLLVLWLAIMIACGIGALILAAADPIGTAVINHIGGFSA